MFNVPGDVISYYCNLGLAKICEHRQLGYLTVFNSTPTIYISRNAPIDRWEYTTKESMVFVVEPAFQELDLNSDYLSSIQSLEGDYMLYTGTDTKGLSFTSPLNANDLSKYRYKFDTQTDEYFHLRASFDLTECQGPYLSNGITTLRTFSVASSCEKFKFSPINSGIINI